VDEFIQTIKSYQEAAGGHFDFSVALKEAEALRSSLVRFYEEIEGLKEKDVNDPQVKEVNS